MAKEILLGHITDLHYPVYTAFKLKDIFSKRITGGANLLFSSRRKFRPHYLVHLLKNLKRIGVDHLLVTGDLVNLGYPEEFAAVGETFRSCGFTPENVTCVPGNHDVYLPSSLEERHFWTHLDGFGVVSDPSEYPFVRDLGEFVVMGLSSAVPSGVGFAYGELGEAQLNRLEGLLKKYADRKKVLMLHHPPYVGRDSFDDGLTDGVRLRKLIWQYGANLLLHGHEHRDLSGELSGPSGQRVPVLGTGCAMLDHKGYGDHARARLIRMEDGVMNRTWVISYHKKTGHWRPVQG